MDLGIGGRSAIVCGASAGLGLGCAQALAAEGVNLTIAARGADGLARAADALRRSSDARIVEVACDVTTPEGRARLIDACPEPDIVINNAAGPPAGDFREWGESEWLAALRGNMLSPIELMRLTIDGMIARRWGRIVNITSGATKAPIGVLGLSNGARSGLTGFVSGLARDVAAHGVTINNLLPGFFETRRLDVAFAGMARSNGTTTEQARADKLANIPAKRFGTPEEFGRACAFLCSDAAAYLTAQNILLDGGAYPGVF